MRARISSSSFPIGAPPFLRSRDLTCEYSGEFLGDPLSLRGTLSARGVLRARLEIGSLAFFVAALRPIAEFSQELRATDQRPVIIGIKRTLGKLINVQPLTVEPPLVKPDLQHSNP